MINGIEFLPVLLGTDQNVYGMARSFHEEYGVKSVAIGKGRLPATANSGIVTVEVVEPKLEDDDIFVKTLILFAKTQPQNVTLLLVPCGDNYIKLLSKNQDKLREYYKFACMSYDLIEKLSYKENFYRTCEQFGFDYPKTDEVTAADYDSFVPEFDFPIIIKPSNSVAYWNCKFEHKKKVFVANSTEEMKAIFKAVYSSSYQDTLIIQEFIPGDDSAMRVMNCYVGTDRKVRMITLGEVLLEEHTPEGIGSYAAIISSRDDELSQKVSDFLTEIGYVGFINIDMKYDVRDGKYKFFEMNLRQGRSSYFVTACGCNLAKFLVEDVILHKSAQTVINSNRHLWSTIPKRIIFKYVSDEKLVAEAKSLIRQGKYSRQLYYKPDMGLKRRLEFIVNQLHYFKKYRENFRKKGYFE
ncbi:MAG: ATP-grasp domain-containing protein [Firmicutes bacterium]|nr:ATP-grasp domain-containing protein [Bacillota bacterium]